MRILITGLGMMTTLGHTVTACAALRCGMSRPAFLELRVLSSGEPPGTEAVVGHPLKGIVDGFSGLGLYTVMALEALRDLLSYSRLDFGGQAFWKDTGLLIGLSKARGDEQEELTALLASRLAPTLITRLGLPLSRENFSILMHSHASAIIAIQTAAMAISDGRIKRALIVCIDSLIVDEDLKSFMATGRLKTPEHPVGLMPGEGAAAILVEGELYAKRRNASMEASVEAIATGLEGNGNLNKKERSNGVVLARTIEQTLSQSERVGAIYGDLTGEEARAREWGNALVRLSKRSGMSDARTWWPAECLGDTGAVSGAVSIAAATRSFIRRYARTNEILVWSRAETGEVASCLLKRV